MLCDAQQRIPRDFWRKRSLIPSVCGQVDNWNPFVEQGLHHWGRHTDISAENHLPKVNERNVTDGLAFFDNEQAFPPFS